MTKRVPQRNQDAPSAAESGLSAESGRPRDASGAAESDRSADAQGKGRREPTRPRLLAVGRELMLARGYNATSVDDICGTAGVSKGSFYHFFGNKEEFGLTVLEEFHRDGVERIRSGDFVRMKDPVARLWGFFDHLEAMGPEFWKHGCLLGTFAAELGETSPRIHARVTELFDDLAARLAPVFQAVGVGEVEAAALAEETLMVIEGAVVMARAHADPDRIAIAVRRYRISLEARMPELSGDS